MLHGDLVFGGNADGTRTVSMALTLGLVCPRPFICGLLRRFEPPQKNKQTQVLWRLGSAVKMSFIEPAKRQK